MRAVRAEGEVRAGVEEEEVAAGGEGKRKGGEKVQERTGKRGRRSRRIWRRC